MLLLVGVTQSVLLFVCAWRGLERGGGQGVANGQREAGVDLGLLGQANRTGPCNSG